MTFQFSSSNFKRVAFHLLLLGVGAAVAAMGQDVVTHTNNPTVAVLVGAALDKFASFIRSEAQ